MNDPGWVGNCPECTYPLDIDIDTTWGNVHTVCDWCGFTGPPPEEESEQQFPF